MTFPNDPDQAQRRELSARVSRKGWVFGGIIIIAAIIVVFAFTWAGNKNSASSTATPPASTTAAGGGSQGTQPGAPASPAKR
jgi:hypothetical protein